jgi:hypothetical protein
MQFSKFTPLVYAAAIYAGFICARAEDNPAQAAARAALEQKMNDLDAQQAATNAATATDAIPSSPAAVQPSQPTVITMTPATPAPSEPAATTPTESQPAPVTTTTADAATQTAARAALDQKMHEMDAQQAATNTTLVTMIAPVHSDTAPVQAPAVATPPQSVVNYPGKELGLKPIDVPPPPVSAEKEAQLQALLAKYVADQVSPEEYQQQRAAILAAP